NPETQSVLTTSPVMREMERESGGLFVATLVRARSKAAQRKAAAARGELLPPAFMTFDGGTQLLVDALVEQLRAMPNVELRIGADVTAVARSDGGWQVALKSGEWLAGDLLLLATPANVAARLIEAEAPDAARQLAAIRHASIGTMTLAYRAEDLDLGFPISGLMIPRRERRAIDAVTFTSERFPNRAPQGVKMVRVFFGGSAPHMMHLDDDALTAAVRGELRALLGLRAAPLAAAVARWPESYPLADVGHLERVAAIEAALPRGLLVTGSAYRGLGVPDCVAQGRESARAALMLPVQVGAGSLAAVPA
ncbi:MAG: protoporphyrinogen oxidase, partial [Caldilineaceae bacterium]